MKFKTLGALAVIVVMAAGGVAGCDQLNANKGGDHAKSGKLSKEERRKQREERRAERRAERQDGQAGGTADAGTTATTGAATATGAVDWASNRKMGAAQAAERRFRRNGRDFGATSVDDYIRKANAFVDNPPAGTQTAARHNGDTLFYNAASNTFAVSNRQGQPRIMMKPKEGAAYWEKAKAQANERGGRRGRNRDRGADAGMDDGGDGTQ